MLTQDQFQTLLIPQLYHFFNAGQNLVPSMRSTLFNVQATKFANIYGTGMGGISPDAWDQWAASGKKASLDFDQLYSQTYTPQRFPVQLVLDKKLLINEQYPIINGSMLKAGVSAEQKMENDAASLLNNAFDTSYPLSDAKPLCSASHPAGPNSGTKTLSNLGTLALSNQAISDTRTLMMKQKDDKGNLIGLVPDELWVPPEMEDVAIKAVGGPSDPTTADRANNPQAAGRWTVRPWLRLSNSKNWFMTSSVWRKLTVNWYEREAFQVMLVDETLTELTYDLMLHYAFGADDWRWVYGNKPA